MSKLISKPDHSDVEPVNAFNWFIKYIDERFNCGKYGDQAWNGYS